MIVYLNGKFLPEAKAHISIYDRGFLYGDGVSEPMRFYDGNFSILQVHLLSLKHSADMIGLKIPGTIAALEKTIEKTVKMNRHREAVVRLTLTRGPAAYGFDPRLAKKPTLLI